MPESVGLITSRDICNQAVVERILADDSVTSLKIYANLQSDNYDAAQVDGVTVPIATDPGTAGWRIERNTGDVVFNNLFIRGDVSSTNWDGTFPADLSSEDTGASAGYYLDSSVGSAQFSGKVYVGDELVAGSGTVHVGKGVTPTAGDAGIAFYTDGVKDDYNNGWWVNSAGTEFFRINYGGANSIYFDTSTGTLTVTGTLYATDGSITGTLEVAGKLAVPNAGDANRIELTSNADMRIYKSGIGTDTRGLLRIFSNGTEVSRIGPIYDVTNRYLAIQGAGFSGLAGNGIAVGSNYVQIVGISRKNGLGGYTTPYASHAISFWTTLTNDTPVGFYHNTGITDTGTHILVESQSVQNANEYHLKMITRSGTAQTNFSFRMDGRAEATGSGQGWFTTSDARTKTLLGPRPAADVESRLRRLAPAVQHYTINTDTEQKVHIGPTAQALEQVYPTSVTGEDMLATKTDEVTWDLVVAVAELFRRTNGD